MNTCGRAKTSQVALRSLVAHTRGFECGTRVRDSRSGCCARSACGAARRCATSVARRPCNVNSSTTMHTSGTLFATCRSGPRPALVCTRAKVRYVGQARRYGRGWGGACPGVQGGAAGGSAVQVWDRQPAGQPRSAGQSALWRAGAQRSTARPALFRLRPPAIGDSLANVATRLLRPRRGAAWRHVFWVRRFEPLTPRCVPSSRQPPTNAARPLRATPSAPRARRARRAHVPVVPASATMSACRGRVVLLLVVVGLPHGPTALRAALPYETNCTVRVDLFVCAP